jgi:predicted permease
MSGLDRLRELGTRLAETLRKRDHDRELDEELRFHIAMETEENLRRGMSLDQAERTARMRLGGLEQVKEAYRDQRTLPLVETLLADARHGLRLLMRSPVFTVVAVLSLALGIGGSSAVFSIVDSVLLKSLPVRAPSRLVFIEAGVRGLHVDDRPTADLFSYPRYEDLREGTDVFEGLAAFASFDWTVYVRDSGPGASTRPEPASARLVSGNYFEVLGIHPFLGRLIGPDDNRTRGNHPVAVLSHGYWLRHFGGDRDAPGRNILVNGHPITVLGVTPPEFRGETVGWAADLWLPLEMQEVVYPESYLLADRDVSFLLLLGRLAPGVDRENAEAAVNVAVRQILMTEAGGTPSPDRQSVIDRVHVNMTPGERGLSGFRRRYGDALLLLMATISLVLLIACANIANLLLARAESRRKEMGVRLSMGAGRSRLLRQLLTESLVLALAGGALGVIVAVWASRFLLLMVSRGSEVVPIDVSVDRRVLAFTLVVSCLTAVIFGLAPALRATRLDIASMLHLNSRRLIEGSSRFGLSKGLVAFQVALSLLLLTGAGLFARSLERLYHVNLGFDPENVLVAEIDPQGGGIAREEAHDLYRRILNRMEGVPGVSSASLSLRPLLSHAERHQSLEVDGYEFQEGESDSVSVLIVTPGYLRTVGMKLSVGRSFDQTDREGAPQVAIVNEAFRRRFLGDRPALGTRIRISDGDSDDMTERTIVGVVQNAKYYRVREEAPEMVFLPAFQTPSYLESVEIRSEPGIVPSADAIRRALAEVSPGLPVSQVVPLGRRVDQDLNRENALAQLTGFFGISSILLAAIGLYGVMSYSVSRRRNEIGIRMALGAEGGRLIRRVLRESLVLLGLGGAFGLAAALVCGRFVESLLYDTTGTDAGALALAFAAVTAAVLLASFLPARRAARVQPAVALRDE